ncbi:tumor necrosis factor alpha-induced protein 8-like protein isoform X1 [Daktulosphaira vitifoliae]|uniref:tumor necrosis factor alpha-induced protein 8-like protein isoform X1 n=2 Tax=Daktulosphaira vitifoliae TaxID=58002 RepID=UPI0021AAFA3E|nr:tumor necrosis factor alpha-induced protein 8-like protein isoform X1 [Daktulosphaira vitifoliae]
MQYCLILGMTEVFKSKEIVLQVQKKFLSKVTNKNVVKLFIDDRNANILDNLYRLTKLYTGNKKDSEKLTKNIIKIIVKLGILYRNDQFNKSELVLAHDFKYKFKELTMISVSFYEIDFSYDRNYLINNLFTCREMLKQLTKRHLTDKTMTRIDKIFDFFTDPFFLDLVFKRDNKLTPTVKLLIDGLKESLDKEF